MTDKEIIEKSKISSNPDNIGCSPTHGLCREALNLIERQRKVIDGFTMIGKLYSEIKAEAVKEFAEDIKGLLKEAEQNSKTAACGYDEGWYNGEENAYATVLKLFGNPEELKGEENG